MLGFLQQILQTFPQNFFQEILCGCPMKFLKIAIGISSEIIQGIPFGIFLTVMKSVLSRYWRNCQEFVL